LVLSRYDRSYQGDDHSQTDPDTSTKIFAWGVVANGRLGHGRPEKVKESGSMRKNRTKSSERFDSRPAVILALENEQIVDISAGKNHSLALSKDGRVFAWGSNVFGQCGVVQFDTHCRTSVRGRRSGKSNDDVKEENTYGILDDIWLPRHLSEFGPMTGKVIASISAGGIHSAAIDRDGKLYTWGGGGDNHCLGHGDSFKDKNGFDFPSESHRRKLVAMAGCLEVPLWGRPREIKCLEGEWMRYVDLGEYGGAAISSLGRMYVWGDKSLKLKMVRLVLSKLNLHVQRIDICRQILSEQERAQDQDSYVSSVDTPSTPLAFDAICDQRYICDIACGLGTTFYIPSENQYGNVLGKRLHDECQSIRRTHDEYDYEVSIAKK
jgi:Regulator of chromosome condensation (RCC1) repeat.